MFAEIGEKSPYERRIDDWRTADEEQVPIIAAAQHDIGNYKNDKRNNVFKRGIYTNKDTAFEIIVGAKGIDDTFSHALMDAKRHIDVSPRLNAMYHIDEIVINSVMLDVETSESGKNKTDNTLFMHKMYAPFVFKDEPFIAKLSVEEFYATDIEGSVTAIQKRFYNMRDIKVMPLNALGVQSHHTFGGNTISSTGFEPRTDTTISISHLFEFVKRFDENFYTNPNIPGRKERIEEIEAEKSEIDESATQSAAFTEKKIYKDEKENISSQTSENFRITDDNLGAGGEKTKYARNIAAIKILKLIESEQRNAVSNEQEILSRYVGWGGVQNAFDKGKSEWEKEYGELKNLLTESEYKAARASVNNAHYTSPTVIKAMYSAIEGMGFSHGRILEPAMGVGNFFGLLPEKMHNGRLYGVELDDITGRIARQLYPNADIQIKGFEKTDFPNNFFDLAIGNVPFGNYAVYDGDYKQDFLIHDHFFRKTLDKLTAGGILAFVTSKGTLDKKDCKVREYLAERADLIGAIRLPNNAFKSNANTEVTTDIIFLQKRFVQPERLPDWCYLGKTNDGIEINNYFIDNPQMILGRMVEEIGRFGTETACVPTDGAVLSEQLDAAALNLKSRIAIRERNAKISENNGIIKAAEYSRRYTFTVVEGRIYFREGGNTMTLAQNLTAVQTDMVKLLHGLRISVRAVIDAQTNLCTDDELQALQADMSRKYDDYRLKYGYINNSDCRKIFGADDDYNTLCSLETPIPDSNEFEKTDIFTKRTIRPHIEITHCGTAEEAFQVSLDQKGKVDLAFIAGLTDKSLIEVIGELTAQNLIFRDPATADVTDDLSGYVEASEYLSGNIRQKLVLAENFASEYPEFARNVSALKNVLPKNIEAQDISVQIGASWINTDDYGIFFAKLTGKQQRHGDMVTRSPINGEYKVTDSGRTNFTELSVIDIYGTKKMNAYKIFENLLNHRQVRVYRKVKDDNGKEKRVIDQKETHLVQSRVRLIKEEFQKWIWSEPIRREKYVTIYNNTFNCIAGRKYDGSHQTFEGMDPDIELMEHQKNAIARAKYGGNTLLAHCVGAGKSFEIIAAVMEKKRLGLINKACIVVPKPLVGQMAQEWQKLYPNARISAANEKDFSDGNRQKFMARCVMGNYDGVIMSYEQFEKIRMSTDYQKQFIQNEIEQLDEALNENDEEFTVKDIELQKKRLEAKLEKLLNGGQKKDASLCFEQYGFDFLCADEAHNYKNGLVVTRMNNISGVTTRAADKSEDMLMKCQYLNDTYGYKNILFSTGTPVTNSMAELYTMQNYLRPDLLYNAGIQNFDDWAGNFGEVVTQLELKPSGDGYRMKTRFAKFNNLPELMAMYREFADIQTAENLRLPIPELVGGKAQTIVTMPDEFQLNYVKILAERAEKLKNGAVDPRDDNMLKITGEARLPGLDPRCIDSARQGNPNGKVSRCIENTLKIYRDTNEKKGVQIIFSDIAVNSDDGRFSVYECIRDELIRHGIPAEEICFAGDAKNIQQRNAMFAELREGIKRIAIASTSKMGTGANVQTKPAAVHHLDIPYRPSDIEQRNGRILRQGNSFDNVQIFHYLTEKTFDAYLTGIITAKQKFISQLMNNQTTARMCEDFDDKVLSYSEMQSLASGDPRIKERIDTDIRLKELQMLEADYYRSLYEKQDLIRVIPSEIRRLENILEQAKSDKSRPVPLEFAMEIKGRIYTERAAADKAILREILKLKSLMHDASEQIIGHYGEFEITLSDGSDFFNTNASIGLKGKLSYSTEASETEGGRNTVRLENIFQKAIGNRIYEIETQIEKNIENLKEAQAKIDEPFRYAEEISALTAKMTELDDAFKMDDLAVCDEENPEIPKTEKNTEWKNSAKQR